MVAIETLTERGRGGEAAPSSPTYFGIKLLEMRGLVIAPPEWLYAFDPDGGDWNVAYPTGHMESGVDSNKAMRFDTRAEAIALWKKTSTRTPLRPDGKPNRPLSAFTVEIVEIPTTKEDA